MCGRYVVKNPVTKTAKLVTTFSDNNIIISTGGASKVYQYTSNPNTSTGDGIDILRYTIP